MEHLLEKFASRRVRWAAGLGGVGALGGAGYALYGRGGQQQSGPDKVSLPKPSTPGPLRMHRGGRFSDGNQPPLIGGPAPTGESLYPGETFNGPPAQTWRRGAPRSTHTWGDEPELALSDDDYYARYGVHEDVRFAPRPRSVLPDHYLHGR